MTDKLLPYYNRELSFIRRLADEFVAHHPDAAERLRMRKGGTDDPHVARLIEAFAYLTARIRRKIDDEFPEISDALIETLYPHYLAPIPSAAIVQFVLDRSQGELTTGYRVDKGSPLEVSNGTGGIACRFRTCYDTTLWPLDVASGEMRRRPFGEAPTVDRARDAAALVHLRLRCVSPKMTFGQFDAETFQAIRFFLAGQDHHVMPLYELLLNHCVQIVVATSAADDSPLVLGGDAFEPVGFAPHESLLPSDARRFPGYGLLSDYFAFPQKFLFVDLRGVGAHPRAGEANQLDVYVFLDRALPDLEPHVDAGTFRLGCTPIVNLFAKRAEPIKLTHATFEYPVIPDARRRDAIEVYSIDRVTTASSRGEDVEYVPLYSIYGSSERGTPRRFWQAHRREASGESTGAAAIAGTQVSLSIVDLDFHPEMPADRTLVVETTCLNRDLPGQISRPRIRPAFGAPIEEEVTCLAGPTATLRPTARQRGVWSLISHLTLGHLSIGNVVDAAGQSDGRGAEALRRILELYDFNRDVAVQERIGAVVGVATRPVVCRLPSAPSGFARGVEVIVDFDEERFRDPGQGVFLLASVLECFFGMYCSINSFTRMTARYQQGARILRQWPPNTGRRYLL